MKTFKDKKRIIEKVTQGGVLTNTALVLAQSRLKQMRKQLETRTLPKALRLFPNFDFKNTVSLVSQGDLTLAMVLQIINRSVKLENQPAEQRDLFMDFISTIWNLYPHKELDDYSPYEIAAMHDIVSEYENK